MSFDGGKVEERRERSKREKERIRKLIKLKRWK